MNHNKSLVRAFAAMAFCAAALVTSSCRKERSAEATKKGPAPVIAPELNRNVLGDLPGAVYGSQSHSPIHWQPWTKSTLERARQAQRLVFCVIATPQQPGFQKVLASLEKDASSVKAINDTYVPILIDGDASREIGILTADLCAEIKRPLQLPLFLWMTHEGNPVAWIPVPSSDSGGVPDLFGQSHTMVSQMWEDVPEYVLKNSALDNANRRSRLEQRKVSKVMSEQPGVDVIRCIRQLASLYDPYSRSFDETGGLFPSSSLELLASASVRPGLPAEVRARCLETTKDLLTDLLPSPMFDPLDGGVFSSRRGVSWSLPSFARDCPTQARVAVALLEAFRATNDPQVLEKALGLIAFAEKSYGTSEGLFSIGLGEETDGEKWMWSVEEVTKILGQEDAAWWIKATGMKGLGNLPSEVDPRREFFRNNTLGLSKTPIQLAADLAMAPDVFVPRFEAAKAKLRAVRDARLGKVTRDDCSNAGASLRMVSAYAAAFGATGDPAYRGKAVSLLKRCQQAFGTGPTLRVFSKETPDSIGTGRGFLYALAIQSVLDVAAITLDDAWLVWSEDLATTATEMFTGNGFLKECPDEAKLIDLPVTDLVMLFDDSTAGLVSCAESRLAEIGRPLVAGFSELATPLPTYAIDRPVLHTDLLLATLSRHYRVTAVLGESLPPAMQTAAERLAMRAIHRRPAKPADNVPAGAIKILLKGDEFRIATTPEALQEAVLPSPAK